LSASFPERFHQRRQSFSALLMTPTTAEPSGLREQTRRVFRRPEWGLVAAIVVVVLVTAALDTQHNYWHEPRASAIDILRQTAMLGIFALGAAIVIVAGGIDLSSGSVIAFGGTICATLMVLMAPEDMKNGSPLSDRVILAAVAGTLVVGFLIGSFHAWLITVVGLPPFVATLATLVGLRSLGRAIVDNVNTQVYSIPSNQISIFDNRFLDWTKSVPMRVVIFAVLALLAWVLLSRTVVGRHLYALGGNEHAARLSGIRTDRLKWLAYCISAILSSLAGILYIGDQSLADPQTLGQGYELNAIAAAVVGGCSLQGGVGTIPGTVLGVLFLRTVIDAVAKTIKSGADVYEGLIVGSVVVVAVASNQLRQAGRRGKRFFAGTLGIVMVLTLALLAGVLAALFGEKTEIGTKYLSFGTAAVTLVVLLLVRLIEGRPISKLSADKAKPPV
jgi:ribose/xylose/arabinose/galactoside ABC-type transport system permease subunit